MNVTVPATTLITCAAPPCDTRVPTTESVYLDSAGQLCENCAGPLPEGPATSNCPIKPHRAAVVAPPGLARLPQL
jgi:hypothetical protein